MKKQDKEVILKWLSVNSTAYDDGVWSWEFRNMLDSLTEDDAYSATGNYATVGISPYSPQKSESA